VNASWIKLHLAATLHPRRTYVDVVLSEVTGVDTVNRRVLLPTCDLPYDYLILATGIHVNYFGHDEWKAIAPGLDGLDVAVCYQGARSGAVSADMSSDRE
jgi:NADH dehydrogenase FAD-containing subunit